MPAWPRRYGNGGAVLRWLRPMDAAIMFPPLLGMRCPMGAVLAGGSVGSFLRVVATNRFLRAPAPCSDVCVAAAALVRALHGDVRRRRKLLWRRPATSVLARLLLPGSRQLIVPARVS